MANNTMTFGVDLIPSGDNQYNLGDATHKWKINGVTPVLTDTDEKVKNIAVTNATTYYLTGSFSSDTAIETLNKHAAIKGYVTANSGTNGSARIDLGNTTATGTAGGKEGILRLYGTTATYYADLKAGAPSANRTFTFPNKSGTIALTTDIPDISGKIDTAGTGLSKSGTTLNHSNSVTKQDTQAVYPIKIDAQGHITGYGSAIVPLTAASTLDATKLSGTIPTSSYTNSRDPGYGKITPANDTSTVTALAGNTTAVQATSYNENLKFTAANKWVVLAGTNSGTAGSDELKIAHFVPSTSITNTGPTANQTPSYGSTFDIPVVTIDAAGHVTEINKATVKIPASDNTNAETQLYVNATAGGAYSNAATTNTSTYVHLYDKLGSTYTKRNTLQLTGSGATTVTANANGVITINSTDADTKVSQNNTTTTDWKKIVLGYGTYSNSNDGVVATTATASITQNISAQPSTGTIRANIYRVQDNVELQWNSTDESLDFIFI